MKNKIIIYPEMLLLALLYHLKLTSHLLSREFSALFIAFRFTYPYPYTD